jgi:PIN domain nuclease of toxin-antitoxin system
VRLLLDTHLLLWSASEPGKLSHEALELIESKASQLHFSVISIWEVAIKTSAGRANFSLDPAQLRSGLVGNGFGEVAVTGEHALAVTNLPWLHRDPFDRMLVGQARVERLTLLTADKRLADYGAPVRLV